MALFAAENSLLAESFVMSLKSQHHYSHENNGEACALHFYSFLGQPLSCHTVHVGHLFSAMKSVSVQFCNNPNWANNTRARWIL